MSGAYVAKPAVVVPPPEGPPTVDDVPPGWDLDWPFPGPYPPGYTPELTYNLNTGATYTPGDTHDAEVTLRDHDIFETTEPDNALTWTATIDEASIELKFSGDSEWSNSLSSDHSVIEDYYGAEPTFLFNVTAADNGSIITLTATSSPFNNQPEITTSAEITVVVEDSYTAKFYCDYQFSVPEDGDTAAGLRVVGSEGLIIDWDTGEITGNAPFAIADVEASYSDSVVTWTFLEDKIPEDEFAITMPGEELNGHIEIEINLCREDIYSFWIRHRAHGAGVIMNVNLTFYKNGEEIDDYNKQINNILDWWHNSWIGGEWIQFNATTKEITVINED